jgi:microcystin-dependent protein
MSDPFVAEIRIFAGNFAPKGWALCDGQLMSISQNTALFSLLGTTYGGDGKSNFALPNLQGSAPMQAGQGVGLALRDLGEPGGEQTVALLPSELPSHSHTFNCASDRGNSTTSSNSYLGTGASGPPNRAVNAFLYGSSGTNAQMNPASLSPNGGDLPHNNMMPYLGLTFIIALQGIFPPRS